MRHSVYIALGHAYICLGDRESDARTRRETMLTHLLTHSPQDSSTRINRVAYSRLVELAFLPRNG